VADGLRVMPGCELSELDREGASGGDPDSGAARVLVPMLLLLDLLVEAESHLLNFLGPVAAAVVEMIEATVAELAGGGPRGWRCETSIAWFEVEWGGVGGVKLGTGRMDGWLYDAFGKIPVG